MKGIGEPSNETLQKLADYFDVAVGWLQGVKYVGRHGEIDFNDAPTQEELDHILGVNSEDIKEGQIRYVVTAAKMATAEELDTLVEQAKVIIENHCS